MGGPLHLSRHRANVSSSRRRNLPGTRSFPSAPDVEGAYEEAQKLGYEIVKPIATEPWGVRRFLVRAPDGNIINIVNHRD
jgi:predicted enzyme related to lactoylglutathione lyase